MVHDVCLKYHSFIKLQGNIHYKKRKFRDYNKASLITKEKRQEKGKTGRNKEKRKRKEEMKGGRKKRGNK